MLAALCVTTIVLLWVSQLFVHNICCPLVFAAVRTKTLDSSCDIIACCAQALLLFRCSPWDPQHCSAALSRPNNNSCMFGLTKTKLFWNIYIYIERDNKSLERAAEIGFPEVVQSVRPRAPQMIK